MAIKTLLVILSSVGMGIIFFLNHLFSFWYNKGEFKGKKPNIGNVMFSPYIRIISMHLAEHNKSKYLDSAVEI